MEKNTELQIGRVNLVEATNEAAQFVAFLASRNTFQRSTMRCRGAMMNIKE